LGWYIKQSFFQIYNTAALLRLENELEAILNYLIQTRKTWDFTRCDLLPWQMAFQRSCNSCIQEIINPFLEGYGQHYQQTNEGESSSEERDQLAFLDSEPIKILVSNANCFR
jgi:hypothetical protein